MKPNSHYANQGSGQGENRLPEQPSPGTPSLLKTNDSGDAGRSISLMGHPHEADDWHFVAVAHAPVLRIGI